MRILVADDEEPKLTSITEWLAEAVPLVEVLVSKSVRSTIDVAVQFRPEIVLLDMSLPTFDIALGESGGRPQGFGGAEVLRHFDGHGLRTKVIVITQYEGFDNNGKKFDLDELSGVLRREHAEIFMDCLHYNVVNDEWKSRLANHLHEFMENGKCAS
ncbi:MAG: response regulator [Pseudomonadota bacterium]